MEPASGAGDTVYFVIAAMIAALLAWSQPAAAETPKPGTVIRDCEDCPEMVVLGPGRFMQGSSSEEEQIENVSESRRERAAPRHEVVIGAPFAIGKHHVT